MFKNSDSGKGEPETRVPPRTIQTGPERSLKGLKRIEIRVDVKEIVECVEEIDSEDH
jgi:hypothetical protein